MRLYYCGLLLTLTCIVSAIAGDFKIPLSIKTHNGYSDTLWFGVNAKATPCIDPALGESEYPPKPPSQLFDVRWVDPRWRGHECLGQGVKVDFRAEPDTYRVDFQAGPGGYPFVFSWPAVKAELSDSLILTDLFGGKLLRVDMRTQTSQVISNNAINSLLIVNRNKSSNTPTKPSGHSPVRIKRKPKPR
jgi:hypothetical protein